MELSQEKKSLLNEFSARQKEKILLNRVITVKRNGSNRTVIFTYKVAAQIGHLGDNVKFLRKQIQDDNIFQLFLRHPVKYQTFIAHTRWASVGEISEPNCHPVDNITFHNTEPHESSNGTGIIHACLNGDIDNYFTLKKNMKTKRNDLSLKTSRQIQKSYRFRYNNIFFKATLLRNRSV